MNAEIFRRIRCCFSNFQRVCDPFFGTVFRSFSELQSEVEKYRPPQTGIIGIAVPRFICGEMDYFGIDDGVEQFIARIQTGKLRIHQQFEQIRVLSLMISIMCDSRSSSRIFFRFITQIPPAIYLSLSSCRLASERC